MIHGDVELGIVYFRVEYWLISIAVYCLWRYNNLWRDDIIKMGPPVFSSLKSNELLM